MQDHPASLEEIIREIDYGPKENKLKAIASIRRIPGLTLREAQPLLDAILAKAEKGSAMRFFAAVQLAFLGDTREETTTNVIMPFMAQGPCLIEGGKPVEFPWLIDCAEKLAMALPQLEMDMAVSMPELMRVIEKDMSLMKPPYFWRHHLPTAVLEAASYLRKDLRIGKTLVEALSETGPKWRPLWIYAISANGNGECRAALEYYREKFPTAPEASAARVGLENFGTKTFIELVEIHQQQKPKSNCLIATAIYGPGSPEVLELQAFRDETLAKSPWGRLLVRSYYATSPLAVRLLANSQFAKACFRWAVVNPALGFVKDSRKCVLNRARNHRSLPMKTCWSCGNSYDGWECPSCAQKKGCRSTNRSTGPNAPPGGT